MSDPIWLMLFLAAVAAVLLWLIRRAWKRKQITSGGQAVAANTLQYAFTLLSWVLGAVLALTGLAVLLYQRFGITVFVVLLLAGGLIWWFRRGNMPIKLGSLPRMRLPSPGKPGKPAAAQPSAAQTPPDPKRWALAAVALQATLNGMDHSSPGGMPVSPRSERIARRRLAREWEADTEDEFHDAQAWLFDSGHRMEFHALISRISSMNAEETLDYLESVALGEQGIDTPEEQEEERHRVEMIRQNTGNVRYLSFLAWDYLRYIENCRLGYLAGFLDEADAWGQMLAAAQALQARYDSWTDLAQSFLTAREFWSVVEHRKDHAAYHRAMARLLDDEQSPWNRVPWGLTLYTGT